ncbi:MAG: hypothetical protein UY58_C0001G0021 [Candidatus Magasanikbacteria bacterium GW2011_GWA2_50_22]|uniref:Uncharacterized protein n=1 Tax=Candidatus Magasanikbacteria bacterium GW2011_GWA2_50_22 TaxID=1619043 RepID=A0A0G1WFP2_9BACT|nr:MAG: hypothetical protein UY58_C0001G0021 [Candidatus Magasanikbacteria bacterium GW2011_GWA2_50_22]
MNSLQLNRTLRLLRRTGDKAVVVDPESDEVFMLMNLDDYEDMLNDIDVCGAGENSNDLDDEDILSDGDGPELPEALVDDFDEASATAEDLDQAKNLTAVERRPEINKKTEGLDFSEVWPKKESSELGNEESLEDVPDEGEEEKFYLEPVE